MDLYLEIRQSEDEFEVEGVKFTLRPEEMQDYSFARHMVNQIDAKQDADASAHLIMNMGILNRIVSWDGPQTRNEKNELIPAPCTTQNKLRFFGRNPGILNELVLQVMRKEVEDQKNLLASQDGKSGAEESPLN